MPKGQNERIKLIAKFLDKSQVINFDKLSSIDDIINLPILTFKVLNEADVDLIYDLFKISTIGQLVSLDSEQPFAKLLKNKVMKKKVQHILQADLEIEEKLKKAVTISRIIWKIKEESISYLEKEQKVVCIGLGNAGKTTLLRKFGGQIGIKDLARLSPTRGVDRQEIVTSDMVLLIWDFGGQEEYREIYLKEPHKYFLNVDLIIYVIDLQEPETFSQSMNYFEKILDNIEKVEENPYILIFIHKFDPDIKDDPEVLLHVEYVKDLIKGVFATRKKYIYEIYLSSIYSMLAKEPKFSRYLKETMQKTATLSDYKIEGLASIMETTLNGIIRLSEVVMDQYNEMDSRLINLEQGKRVSKPTRPTPGPPPSKIPSRKEIKSARAVVLNELKELIDKNTQKGQQ